MQGTISKEGRIQVEKLANGLRAVNIDCIYSSDLERCVYTARVIAKYHPDVRIEFTSELRERNLGIFQGRLKSSIPQWEKIVYDPEYVMPEGESIEDVYNRMSKFIVSVFRSCSNKTVLAVGHGFSGRVLISILQKIPKISLADIPRIRNGESICFEIGDGGEYGPIALKTERIQIRQEKVGSIF